MLTDKPTIWRFGISRRPQLFAIAVLIAISLMHSSALAQLECGAAIVDVSPTQFPVIVNGSMTSHTADSINTPIHARAIVIGDGRERIGIVVVDSCMMPKQLLDEVKGLAATRTQLKPDRILISATHTHSAPSCMGALGTDPDLNYIPLLRQKLVEALEAAEARLQPAEVGWGAGDAAEFTALRRWVRRPDRIENDPFGNPTVRANMHSARNPDDAIGPTGPEDPQLSMIAFRSAKDKTPIAVLANFSMHYFSDKPISADYFGLFCNGLQSSVAEQVGSGEKKNPFVAALSHGCSGDIWRRDYFLPASSAEMTIEHYTDGLLKIAKQIYSEIEYQPASSLAMSEARLPLKYRVPDAQRLEWAKKVMESLGDRLPTTTPEVYAREQVILNDLQSTEIVVQALRIGDIAIATTPNETYALTGLKLKLQSPLAKTMVIELANGGDGYIPPPEQHILGGYNTWAARSAGLEVAAESKIVAADLNLLEKVCGQPRRSFRQTEGTAAEKVRQLKPYCYWRLDEFSPSVAVDESANRHNASYEPGVLYFLDGDDRLPWTKGETNRCCHFAGGRMSAELPEIKNKFTLRMSFWNGMPIQGRGVTGWMFSRDDNFGKSSSGLHLGLTGTDAEPAGRLQLLIGEGPAVVGKSPIERWTWHQVALVVDGEAYRVYLDGKLEIETSASAKGTRTVSSFFFGGRSDNQDNWEGKLDEIALFDRPLTKEELQTP